MTAEVNTASMNRIGSPINISVECKISTGIGIHIVGMPDIGAKECLLRTVTALQSLGYRIPGKKIVITIKTEDKRLIDYSGFDLPVAVALLLASGQVKLKEGLSLSCLTFFGELRIDGSLCSYGHLGHAVGFAAMKNIGDYVPLLITDESTAIQVALAPHIKPFAFRHLCGVIDFLTGEKDGIKQLVWNTDTFRNIIESIGVELELDKKQALQEQVKRKKR